MCNQKKQEMLVSELRQNALFGRGEKGGVGITHHYQRVPATQIACLRCRAGAGPKAVVAIALLKVAEVLFGKGQAAIFVGFGRTGHQPESEEVLPAQGLRLVQSQIRHQRHAVVLYLAVAQLAHLVRMVAHQRQQQPSRQKYAARGVG